MTISSTLDGLLNRRVLLEQPAEGYRVAIDTVLLAAAVPARKGELILDLGCGVGGAMLCVAARVAAVRGLGLEIQDELASFCKNNILRNAFAAGLEVRRGDATALPPELEGAFDHAMMNPPYHDAPRHDVSLNVLRRTANTEAEGDLPLWIASAAAALKPSGVLTLIHRADRSEEIVSLMRTFFGECERISLRPKEGASPKRVIFRARKGGAFVLTEGRALVLHKDTGGYTDEAEAVLRHGERL